MLIIKRLLIIIFLLVVIRILYVAGQIGLVHLDLHYFDKIPFEADAEVIEKPIHFYIINKKEDNNNLGALNFIGIRCLVQWEDGKIERITLPSKEILKINTLLKIKGEKTFIFGITSVNNFQIINNKSAN